MIYRSVDFHITLSHVTLQSNNKSLYIIQYYTKTDIVQFIVLGDPCNSMQLNYSFVMLVLVTFNTGH